MEWGIDDDDDECEFDDDELYVDCEYSLFSADRSLDPLLVDVELLYDEYGEVIKLPSLALVECDLFDVDDDDDKC